MTNPRSTPSSSDSGQTSPSGAEVPVLNPASTEKSGTLSQPQSGARSAGTETDGAPGVSRTDGEDESAADQPRSAGQAKPRSENP